MSRSGPIDMAKADDAEAEMEVAHADVLRANLYRMLAHVLTAPPQRTDLDLLAGLEGDETPLGRAVRSLSRIAARATPASVDREYHVLFIGLGEDKLVPFGSHYRGGSRLEVGARRGARALDIRAGPDIGEAEDHIAALCEMMGALILGRFGGPATVDEQRAFFNAHMASWARAFFTDLEGAGASLFYAAVGKVGSVFMTIEEAQFEFD